MYSEGMRQAPDDRARDASAGPTEVRQPRTKGSLTGPRIGLLSPEHLAITRHSRGNNTYGHLICGLVEDNAVNQPARRLPSQALPNEWAAKHPHARR
jgi:hypothetical protein